MTILFDCGRLCKPYRPFGTGLYTPLPPEPAADAMPRPVRVRWHALDLTMPEDLAEPEPTLTLSGSWATPGEDVHSWDFGHGEEPSR